MRPLSAAIARASSSSNWTQSYTRLGSNAHSSSWMLSGSRNTISGPPRSSCTPECAIPRSSRCFAQASSAAVWNSYGKVVEADCTFVESVGDPVRMRQQANGETAWVVHSLCLEARPFVSVNKFEAHDLFPPPGAALSVSDRQVDMPEAVDRGEVHCDSLPRQEPLALVRAKARLVAAGAYRTERTHRTSPDDPATATSAERHLGRVLVPAIRDRAQALFGDARSGTVRHGRGLPTGLLVREVDRGGV
jgi:hypothetical protein